MGGAEQSCSQKLSGDQPHPNSGTLFSQTGDNYEKLCPITLLVQLALQDTVSSCSISVEQPSGVTRETNAV
eukprot:3911362-Rhodomonas_salina.1